jgi:polycomb group RING finger protein 3
MCADEIKREREFYRMRGLPCPKDIPPNAGELEEEKTASDQHAESDYHRQDEQVTQKIILIDVTYCIVTQVGFKSGAFLKV